MSCFKPVTHVIFDCDGLLLNTEPIHMSVMAEMVERRGKEFPEKIKLLALGRTEMDSIRILKEECDLIESIDDLRKEFVKGCEILLPKAHLMPGAAKLVRHLYSQGIPIAVGTSSSKEGMEAKTLNHRELFKLFHHIVMGSSDPEVKHGKPAPDIFLICASRFPGHPPPEKCIVFEDAPNGIQAACDAGMQCVMVPDPNLDPELTKKATLVLKNLADFEPTKFGLPPYCKCLPQI